MHLQVRIHVSAFGLLVLLNFPFLGQCKTGLYYASIKQFPSQVSVELDKTNYCGGAVVGDQWVVTAKSCIPENLQEVDRVKVRAGSSYLGSGGAFHSVSKLVKFEKSVHVYPTTNADLSMIKVDTPFYYSPYIQWSYPNLEELTSNMRFAAAGYIRDKKKKKVRLQRVFLKSLSREDCQGTFEGKVNITGDMGCFVGATKKDDTCTMKVGTPIAADGLIYAIVLNKDYCKSKGQPIIVTHLDNASGSIVQTMAEFIPRNF